MAVSFPPNFGPAEEEAAEEEEGGAEAAMVACPGALAKGGAPVAAISDPEEGPAARDEHLRVRIVLNPANLETDRIHL
ncbi:MAG TPA: hypothetical protein VIY86_10050, partial [Pirellulaceae bacterium]